MLSWNEIRHRAIAFSRDWKGTTSEKSERQTFWNEFFDIFGIRRRTVAAFEEPVRKLSGNWGYIDLFWPARVLVEHKSAGQCLDKAHAQGIDTANSAPSNSKSCSNSTATPSAKPSTNSPSMSLHCR